MFCCIYMCAYDINVFTSNCYILLFLFFRRYIRLIISIYIIHTHTHTYFSLLALDREFCYGGQTQVWRTLLVSRRKGQEYMYITGLVLQHIIYSREWYGPRWWYIPTPLSTQKLGPFRSSWGQSKDGWEWWPSRDVLELWVATWGQPGSDWGLGDNLVS